MVKITLKYLAVPMLLLIGAAGSALAIAYRLNYELMALAIFLSTAAFILLLEHWIPLRADWEIRRKDVATDTKYFLSTALFDALGKAAALWLILSIHHWFALPEYWKGWPFFMAFAAANVLGEFLPYLYHRVSHVGNKDVPASRLLWKVHAIHHLPEVMNWLKTSWMHPLNMVVNTFLKFGPLFLLGFSEEVIFAVGVMHIVVAYLSHANMDARTGILDYIIVTPKIHHFHHSTRLSEAKNYGNILPFWDLVFGTYYRRAGQVEQVGVLKGDYEYPPHGAFARQMMFPLVSRARRPSVPQSKVPPAHN